MLSPTIIARSIARASADQAKGLSKPVARAAGATGRRFVERKPDRPPPPDHPPPQRSPNTTGSIAPPPSSISAGDAQTGPSSPSPLSSKFIEHNAPRLPWTRFNVWDPLASRTFVRNSLGKVVSYLRGSYFERNQWLKSTNWVILDLASAASNNDVAALLKSIGLEASVIWQSYNQFAERQSLWFIGFPPDTDMSATKACLNKGLRQFMGAPVTIQYGYNNGVERFNIFVGYMINEYRGRAVVMRLPDVPLADNMLLSRLVTHNLVGEEVITFFPAIMARSWTMTRASWCITYFATAADAEHCARTMQLRPMEHTDGRKIDLIVQLIT